MSRHGRFPVVIYPFAMLAGVVYGTIWLIGAALGLVSGVLVVCLRLLTERGKRGLP